MKIRLLYESKIAASKVQAAMATMVSYLERKLGQKLVKVPGVEHFKNTENHGYGMRYFFDGTIKGVRFNWSSESKAGNAAEITSIDYFSGRDRNPTFSIQTKGLSLVKSLPALVTVLKSPTLGKMTVFPVEEKEALTEQVLAEAKRDDFTAEQAVTDFLKKLSAGKTFTRSEFIGMYHIVHAGIFDAVLSDLKDKFQVDAKRVSIKPGIPIESLKDSIMSKAGIIEVTQGGKDEVYLKTPEEEQLENKPVEERIPFVDVLEHLEGLVTGIINGAFYALFVSGKGGCLSGNTLINVKQSNPDTTMKTVSFYDIENLVKAKYSLSELEINELYKLDDILIETPDGFKKTVGFMKKQGKKAIVEFENGIKHECLHTHMYIPDDGTTVYAYDLCPGRNILMGSGKVAVKNVTLTDEDMIAYDLSVDTLDGIYVTADGVCHHNTGKTQTVERVLHSHGLTDGNGYFKNTGSASASGVYTLLYHHRNDIILFDDSDGALADQDARNLIKAATDTKKVRKLVWNKKSSFIYDPEDEDAEQYEDDTSMAPKYFDFKGRIIFISNLPLEKLDPDGALRTRAFIINVNPTDEEMFEYMEKILHDIKLEGDVVLTKAQREEVFEVVKTSRRKTDVSLRKLVRALNLAASGASNWKKLVELYS